jgi:hypothetical protein
MLGGRIAPQAMYSDKVNISPPLADLPPSLFLQVVYVNGEKYVPAGFTHVQELC